MDNKLDFGKERFALFNEAFGDQESLKGNGYIPWGPIRVPKDAAPDMREACCIKLWLDLKEIQSLVGKDEMNFAELSKFPDGVITKWLEKAEGDYFIALVDCGRLARASAFTAIPEEAISQFVKEYARVLTEQNRWPKCFE